jgi:AbrB family looped-hinge helix DNA binding protein
MARRSKQPPSCGISVEHNIIIPLEEVLPMTVVTISSRFQVVIPKDVRERLNLKPGQQVEAIPFRGRVELIPLEPVEAMRGALRGIDTTVPREKDRV